MEHYVGLDVSLEETAVCVLDSAGKIVWRGRCSSDPEAIARIVRERAPFAVRIGLETGQLSTWLVHSLRRLGLPVVCLDARHAKAALSLQVNKTDDNDAHGLAQIVRTGWYREVAVKSMDSQAVRVLLMARAQLISQRQATANQIRGLLKTFGLMVGQAGGSRFAVRVRELVRRPPGAGRDRRTAADGLADPARAGRRTRPPGPDAGPRGRRGAPPDDRPRRRGRCRAGLYGRDR